MSTHQKREILLESGTNEVEVAEFLLGSQSFGVNVAKIREFVPYDHGQVTKLPDAPPSLEGMFLLRGRTIPLINLNRHLDRGETVRSERPVVLVTEFNNMVNGFMIDAVLQIHRLSWSNIKPLNPILAGYTPRLTGSVHVKDTEILILDLEYIIGEVFPKKMRELIGVEDDVDQTSPKEIPVKGSLADRRRAMKIVLAEDSAMIRNYMKKALTKAGYQVAALFDNGQDAYEWIVKTKDQAEAARKDITDYINLIVLDIEMPQMDGLTLCKKIKQGLRLTQFPVVMFSSLINEQMARKCDSVGADSYVSKPQMNELVGLLDSFLMK
ncbi:MAG: chemotaxis protein CheV [Deltaproteobacteria bacterium]|nr:chemotaxis protein CheV [Deltaproteobacteria bacterium]